MGGKETGCSGARIWVGWSCVRGVRWKQVCFLQVMHGLGVGLDNSVVTKG